MAMTHWEIEDNQSHLLIRASQWGRWMAALTRGVMVAPLAMGALMVVFMPDYLFRWAEEEPMTGAYWLAFSLLAGLAGFLSGLGRYLRRDQWAFDVQSEQIVAETQGMWGPPKRGEAALEELAALELYEGPLWRRNILGIRLHSGERKPIGWRWGGADELASIGQSIADFVAPVADVEVERVDTPPQQDPAES